MLKPIVGHSHQPGKFIIKGSSTGRFPAGYSWRAKNLIMGITNLRTGVVCDLPEPPEGTSYFSAPEDYRRDKSRRLHVFYKGCQIGDLLLIKTNSNIFYDKAVARHPHFNLKAIYLTRSNLPLSNLEVCNWYAEQHEKGISVAEIP